MVVIGSGCPARLLPIASSSYGDPFDLVVLAPTHDEAVKPGWVATAAQVIDSSANQDALVYVLAGPSHREKIFRALGRQGFCNVTSFVHLPDWEASRYLVPLDLRPARDAFNRVISVRSWKRILTLAALSIPGGARFLGDALPQAGFAWQRAGSRPLLSWLYEIYPDFSEAPVFWLGASWQGEVLSLTIHVLPSDPVGQAQGRFDSQAVVKVILNRGHQPAEARQEADKLASLGDAAHLAGVRIPKGLATGLLGSWPVFVQSAVPGQSVASILQNRPRRLLPVVEKVLNWLEAWNRATASLPLDLQELQGAVIEPARLLAAELEQGNEYVDWLSRLCKQAAGKLPRVVAHNDLTVWNMLLDHDAGLSVVDWETADPVGLALADFFYMFVDAVLVTMPHLQRDQAFIACFGPGRIYKPVLINAIRRLAAAVHLPGNFINLCLHACMLHHARNEQQRALPGEPRPFLKIIAWLAEHPTAIESWAVS